MLEDANLDDLISSKSKTLDTLLRTLQILHERAAIYGINTPPTIVIEIEDLQGQIEKLKQEIVELEKKARELSKLNNGKVPKAVDRKLRVFLCHSSTDKPIVRELYQRLLAEGWIDPWLDEEKLLPGQDWDIEIEKAVEAADAVIVCLSNNSVSKEGYVQKELRFVLDVSDEKPEETIFIVPIRLDECPLPRRLKKWQYVDYFPKDRKEWAFNRVLNSLKLRGQCSSVVEGGRKVTSGDGGIQNERTPTAKNEDSQKSSDWLTEIWPESEDQGLTKKEINEDREVLLKLANMLRQPSVEEMPFQALGRELKTELEKQNLKDGLNQIPLAAFLVISGLLSIFPVFSSIIQAPVAILAGIFLLLKRKLSENRLFLYTLIAYFVLWDLVYFVAIPFESYLIGTSLLLSGVSLIWAILQPKVSNYFNAPFATIAFGLFLATPPLSTSKKC